MKIACLGWGSLIWDSGTLPIHTEWFLDGPSLPIEFARESRDGRITLVIADVERNVQSLWALMTSTNIECAKKALAKRENICDKNIQYSIGFWCRESNESCDRCADVIGEWAMHKEIDAVIWTKLKCGFKKARDKMPTGTEVIEHLRKLRCKKKENAQQYICNAPLQIRTAFREKIAVELGWMPESVSSPTDNSDCTKSE